MKKLIALILAVTLLSLTMAPIPVSAEDTKYRIEMLNYEFLGTSPTGLNDYIVRDKDGNIIKNEGLVIRNYLD
jgi:hypothetical protein